MMDTERFNDLVKEIREASLDTLTKKNAKYATAEDRLHNFKVGAAITGGTPAQAALGYMAKHLASLQDKVARNDFHDREDLKEKIQDSINYLVFIWCCANEERDELKKELAAMRNELCCKCGKYREAHNGACDGCRWRNE